MLRINRIKAISKTESGNFGFDYLLTDGLNLISSNIIWSYTLALLKTSNEKNGNHPQIVIFDEPGQHSIVTNDMVSLFNEIIEMRGTKQVILGITLNDGEIKSAVDSIDSDKIHIVDVGKHAFRKLS